MGFNKNMRKELDEELCRKFPNLYRMRHGNMKETCMCWGFSCNNGWYQLIYNLSEKLEAEILKQPEEEREHFHAAQVKEKFGSLRYCLSGGTDVMWDLIEKAENASAHICEICGKPGEENIQGNWVSVSCKDHMDRQRLRSIESLYRGCRKFEMLIKHGLTMEQARQLLCGIIDE
jgi:hypothetical protein